MYKNRNWRKRFKENTNQRRENKIEAAMDGIELEKRRDIVGEISFNAAELGIGVLASFSLSQRHFFSHFGANRRSENEAFVFKGFCRVLILQFDIYSWSGSGFGLPWTGLIELNRRKRIELTVITNLSSVTRLCITK